MKDLRHNQYGFHALEVTLVVVVAIGVGFAGWRVYSANNSDAVTNQSTETPQVAEVQSVPIEEISAPEVQSTADLDAAKAALDQLEASNSLDESQFDAAVNELL